MNMSELAQLAAQKANHIHHSNPEMNSYDDDESPELKTPTADQHGMSLGQPMMAPAMAQHQNQQGHPVKVSNARVSNETVSSRSRVFSR